jgi:arabinogalactan endo-1,4-beta-galactosidase
MTRRKPPKGFQGVIKSYLYKAKSYIYIQGLVKSILKISQKPVKLFKTNGTKKWIYGIYWLKKGVNMTGVKRKMAPRLANQEGYASGQGAVKWV